MNGNRYSEASIICGGNINDPGICLYLAKVKRDLQKILHADRDELQIKKVERWNSVRVTFRLPHNAVQRLRTLAEKNPEALRSLGILSVQVDGTVTRNIAATGPQPSTANNVSSTTTTTNVNNNNNVNINNNNNNNSSTSSVYNINNSNNINNNPSGVNIAAAATVSSYAANVPRFAATSTAAVVRPDADIVKRTVAGIIRNAAVPQQQQQHHHYDNIQGSAAPLPSTSYAPPQPQQQSPLVYANYCSTNAAATFINQQPPQHQQLHNTNRINFSAHCGTNSNVNNNNTSSAEPPNSSPLLTNLLKQHSPPPQPVSSINNEPQPQPPAKKRKKSTKEKKQQQQQTAAVASTSSYCGPAGSGPADVQVTNYSSQTNLVSAHHQQRPPFYPSSSPAAAAATNPVKQPSGYSNFTATDLNISGGGSGCSGDLQVLLPQPVLSSSRTDRDATISSAIDSVVSRVSMPATPTAVQPQPQNIQQVHWMNEDKSSPVSSNVIGHSGHVEGGASDLSNVHQSPAMYADAAVMSTTPTHHTLHSTNRITTPTNHISESQHHQSAQQQSPYYGNVDYLHHLPPPTHWPHHPPVQQQQQQQFQQHQLQQSQSYGQPRPPPCSLPLQQQQQAAGSSAAPQPQPQMHRDLHANVWLSPPPSYGAVCHVTNLAVHSSQTKVNSTGGGSALVNGDDQNVGGSGSGGGGGGVNMWRRDPAAADVAAALNCHDSSELRWTDHDYLSDGYHHQQNLNLINSASGGGGDLVLHTATATASAVVTSGGQNNPLFNKGHPLDDGQWSGLTNLPNTEVRDTFGGSGGGPMAPATVHLPLWHSMPFDGKTSIGVRTVAPNVNSPQLQPVLPDNILHGNYSPG